MSVEPTAPPSATRSPEELERENAALRDRLAALEQELIDVQARANTAIAAAQERAYWLDRWHVDLNALMRKRGAKQARGAFQAIRAVVRAWRRAWRAVRRTDQG
jgi:hypothetical protein